jgi:anti-anti-sigma regulatory factor
MSVRITSSSESSGTVVVHIAGKLRNEDIGELEREASGVTGPLVLDVSDLTSTDAAGAESLKAMAHRGAELRGVSPYLALLLERNERSL